MRSAVETGYLHRAQVRVAHVGIQEQSHSPRRPGLRKDSGYGPLHFRRRRPLQSPNLSQRWLIPGVRPALQHLPDPTRKGFASEHQFRRCSLERIDKFFSSPRFYVVPVPSPKSWARLIQEVYETGPLLCECGSKFEVILVIEARNQSDVVGKILACIKFVFEVLAIPDRPPSQPRLGFDWGRPTPSARSDLPPIESCGRFDRPSPMPHTTGLSNSNYQGELMVINCGVSSAGEGERNGSVRRGWLIGISAVIGLFTLCSSAFGQGPIPGDARWARLQYIVPDMACWFNKAQNAVSTGSVKLQDAAYPADLGNWEPCTGVVGDDTFLIAFNTYATDGTFANQNFVVAKQPARGGRPRLDYSFWDDNGHPFTGQINLSRQNGNPQRVAGDRRHGGRVFITSAEISIGQIPEFQLVNRWSNNDIYQGLDRYAGQQLFRLRQGSLEQKPIAKAWDYVYGPYEGTMGPGNNAPQCTRTGGRCEFLDNGNIVVMIDDKTSISSPLGEVTTFAIIQPDGKIVKGPTLVDPRNIWENMCAFRGGFCIRVVDSIYFYDDDGNLRHVNSLAVANADLETTWGPGTSYYIDRGDLMRVASDIRSCYVYMAGGISIPGSKANPCMMAVWDGRSGAFLGNAMVSSDLDPASTYVDRTALAVNADDEICVVYDGIADTRNPHYNLQTIARVLRFDGRKIKPLTPSFFAFVNSDNRNTIPHKGTPKGFLTFTPSVSMTTKAICIAAKGWINSKNKPANGPDTSVLYDDALGTGYTTVYTVISTPPHWRGEGHALHAMPVPIRR